MASTPGHGRGLGVVVKFRAWRLPHGQHRERRVDLPFERLAAAQELLEDLDRDTRKDVFAARNRFVVRVKRGDIEFEIILGQFAAQHNKRIEFAVVFAQERSACAGGDLRVRQFLFLDRDLDEIVD